MAKGLLLKGDLELELVLLCKDKPTICLLKKVSDNLVSQLKVLTSDSDSITVIRRGGASSVKSCLRSFYTFSRHLVVFVQPHVTKGFSHLSLLWSESLGSVPKCVTHRTR